MNTFKSGLQIYLGSLFQLFARSPLRRWYFSAVLRTFVIAISLVLLLLFGGGWLVWSLLGGDWLAGIGAFLWVVVVIYISGVLSSALSSSVVLLLSSEKTLLDALDLKARDGLKDVTPLKKASWEQSLREYRAVALSVMLSVTCWPLLIFPLLLPFGILIFAWTLGREAIWTADRLCSQNQEKTLLESGIKPSIAMSLGVGVVPAVATLIPFIGWCFLPILQISGVQSVRFLRENADSKLRPSR